MQLTEGLWTDWSFPFPFSVFDGFLPTWLWKCYASIKTKSSHFAQSLLVTNLLCPLHCLAGSGQSILWLFFCC